ncbi:MAG: LacI family DNA-binding transcriptional regulator [Opitutae bacterium]|nr:LacI family DNA-binding transcriptional regulator [Opitutae bacterium]
MKSIALKAGVTQATVSMCLANNPRISAATRARVQALAQELGYRPNPFVSALMRQRRQGQEHLDRPVVALVNVFDRAEGWREHVSPMIRQMREGALERAAMRGYRGQEFWLHQDDMSPERFCAMLQARGIQGMLLGPRPDTDQQLPVLRWDAFAVVSLSVPEPALTLTTVCNDHYFSMLQTIRECHRRGYRRPGLVMRQAHRARFQGRWDAGFLVSRLLLPGMRLTTPLLFSGRLTGEALAGWLKAQKPDVVVSLMANDVLSSLNRQGLRVPADIGVAWLSCPEAGHAISGVYQNGQLIGATGMDTLISMIERNERGLPAQASTVMIEGVWNPGTTLRAAPV